jgi:5-(carboxyamino)imidazole ribonucleotide mutase
MVALPCADIGRNGRNGADDTSPALAFPSGDGIPDGILLRILHDFEVLNMINNKDMTPIVSIIMGSTSDLPVMEKACKFLNDMQIPFEVNALSAHRTPQEVEEFACDAEGRGLRIIIAGAGMAAALPGVIAANTTLPVIGVPIKGMLDGLDALLSIVQMPPGIPVATVGVNGAQNAALLAVEMLALSDKDLAEKLKAYKQGLKEKIVKANAELAEVKYKFKVN